MTLNLAKVTHLEACANIAANAPNDTSVCGVAT